MSVEMAAASVVLMPALLLVCLLGVNANNSTTVYPDRHMLDTDDKRIEVRMLMHLNLLLTLSGPTQQVCCAIHARTADVAGAAGMGNLTKTRTTAPRQSIATPLRPCKDDHAPAYSSHTLLSLFTCASLTLLPLLF
jgi:hypothetical protein